MALVEQKINEIDNDESISAQFADFGGPFDTEGMSQEVKEMILGDHLDEINADSSEDFAFKMKVLTGISLVVAGAAGAMMYFNKRR